MTLRIEQVDVFGYDLSYVHGDYAMSGGRVVRTLPSTVVRLTTDEGDNGWGEVCPLGQTYLPAFAEGARAALRELAPELLGLDPCNVGLVNERMDAVLSGHGYAKSPVDAACWDLLGKATDRPVAALLGGRLQEKLPLYNVVPLGVETSELADYVQASRDQGVHRFQVKVGSTPEEDAERVRRVHQSTVRGDVVVADANGGWRLRDAIVAARLLEPLERVYLEQPCPTLEECAAVRKLTTLPIFLDEIVTDAQSLIAAFQVGGASGINLKVSRVGGLTKARFIRDLAAALGVSVIIEDTWGGDLATAAISSLGASTPQRSLFAVYFMNDLTQEHIAGYEPRSQNGYGRPSSRPGLGVEVDVALLGDPLFTSR